MHRRTYTTPLLVGLLTLAACPSDDVGIDTEGTTIGGTTEDPTTAPPPTTTPTTIDPDDSTTMEADSSTGPIEMCEPACEAGECCVAGACFSEPAPSCASPCGTFEVCQCPEGSDPCTCVAECVACGVDGGVSYDPCLDVDCPDGSFCVLDDPAAPTFGWCAQQDCGTDDCACPLPTGGTAVPGCGAFDGDAGNGSCFLDCSADDAECPEGMLCRTLQGESACVWPGEGIASDCCFYTGGTTGCDDPTCEMTVCDVDAYCCDTEWDDICVGEAQQLCGGLCPIENAQPQYGDCINVGDCDLGFTCISDGGMTFGWCGTIDCADDTVCQPPPATGDAPAVCAPINDMTNACLLDCSMGQTCPDGMVCFDSFVCVWEEVVPPPPMLPNYGDCADNPAVTCQPTEDACFIDAGSGAGACTQTGCANAGECPAAPATGDAPVACGDLGMGNTCYLDCAGGQTCPDGTVCTATGGGASACLWPEDGFLLDEDFEIGALRPGWSVIDVDGNVPDGNVAFVDDAFVVTDEFEPGANFGAYSTSWYSPAGQSDDWLITPQITLGAASTLSWEAWAPDAAFPDGYEVRVSTGMPTVADFMANAAVFTIANEADVFTAHMVDLAAAGYMNQAVYIAFRNNSNDEFILVVDNVRVTQ